MDNVVEMFKKGDPVIVEIEDPRGGIEFIRGPLIDLNLREGYVTIGSAIQPEYTAIFNMKYQGFVTVRTLEPRELRFYKEWIKKMQEETI